MKSENSRKAARQVLDDPKFVKLLKKSNDIDENDVLFIVDYYFQFIKEEIQSGRNNSIRVPGLGTFRFFASKLAKHLMAEEVPPNYERVRIVDNEFETVYDERRKGGSWTRVTVPKHNIEI